MDDDFDDLLGGNEEIKSSNWFTTEKINKIKHVHDYLDNNQYIGKVLSLASSIRVAEIVNDNRELNSLDTNKLKVNEVAGKLNGGGHEGASGAYANNLDDALNIINEWSKKLNYNFEHVSI